MLMLIKIYKLTSAQIIIITIISLLIFTIIVLTSLLVIFSSYKNKQFMVYKNLQYIQNINIKERLNRINQMVQANEQYSSILGIWISRYNLFLKKDLNKVFKNYIQILKLQNNKELWKRYKLMYRMHNKSNNLKNQLQLLTIEIDYFISIDQLLREYQLFFKQNFNYLQDQMIKINLQNDLNREQLDEVIKIINDMFKELETNINAINVSQIITILSEIAIAVVTLAEILDNLPTLRYIITYEIKQKMAALKNKYQMIKINNTLLLQYEQLVANVDEKLSFINKQINNLQYKKAKVNTQEILKLIATFSNKIDKEQIFYNIFKQNYEKFLVMSFNFNEIFETIKNEIVLSNKINSKMIENSKITNLETIINKQLATVNHFDNLLIIEHQKSIKNTSYETLVMLLAALFENSIVVFNSLKEYNKLLNEQNKVKIKFKTYVDKINSMMLQIDNILNNINFYYLNEIYKEKFSDLQYLINDTILNFKNGNYDNSSFSKFNDLQNKIFHLYTELKMEITIHKLSHLTLVYVNRHRSINQQLNSKFNEIENNITNNHNQKALTLLLELME
ncbi:septation ring formation regulator [Spiroplasma ixodetis Y32]|nr:septation ring formation regulator [Spiroplasma ixodetis Y32]